MVDRIEKPERDPENDESIMLLKSPYLIFIGAAVSMLKNIRDNPTPAKIDNLLIDLQALTMEQRSIVVK